ncbi:MULTISPECIES: RDD family protein [unclassified Moraxella]|uniref:RDD family protein n=1 Tax=unclassified Moraxella TaxID=2685852 RepID=UPI003AF73CED
MYIFLARDNVQAGPYSLEQLNYMLASNQVYLTDLMWHEGMANWQTVAEMTQGQFVYHPTIVVTHPDNVAQPSPTVNQPIIDDEPDYIINNTPEKLKAEAEAKAQAQAEAKAKAKPKVDDKKSQSVWDKYTANNPHKTEKSDKPSTGLFGKKNQGMDVSHTNKQLELASIGGRIVAKLIDAFLLFLPTFIVFISVANSPVFDKIVKLAESNQSPMLASQQMNQLLLEAVPPHILTLTTLLFWAIIITQMVLMNRRGQTLGKMAMRIRVLDKQSNAIPSFSQGVLLRSIVLIAMVLTLGLGLAQLPIFILAFDFITLFTNPDRQSLHDKIARTYVVRADDTQTTPLELTPDA